MNKSTLVGLLAIWLPILLIGLSAAKYIPSLLPGVLLLFTYVAIGVLLGAVACKLAIIELKQRKVPIPTLFQTLPILLVVAMLGFVIPQTLKNISTKWNDEKIFPSLIGLLSGYFAILAYSIILVILLLAVVYFAKV